MGPMVQKTFSGLGDGKGCESTRKGRQLKRGEKKKFQVKSFCNSYVLRM